MIQLLVAHFISSIRYWCFFNCLSCIPKCNACTNIYFKTAQVQFLLLIRSIEVAEGLQRDCFFPPTTPWRTKTHHVVALRCNVKMQIHPYLHYRFLRANPSVSVGTIALHLLSSNLTGCYCLRRQANPSTFRPNSPNGAGPGLENWPSK